MRTLWTGALSFGLVHIPIRMYTASSERELHFKLLHKKDLSEVRYARICVADEKEIPWEDIVKGYEYEKGHYVVLTEEDFQKAYPEKTKTIEILDFTDEDQVDTIYYDTPYYLEPEKGAENAYGLLYEALKQTKKIAVGRFVFHNHEHIGAIRVHKNILLFHVFRYESEIRSVEDLKVPKRAVSKTELSMAIKLINELTKPFKPENYSDTYTKAVKAIIKKKSKGIKITTPTKKKKSAKTQDILSLLKASLEEKEPRKKRKSA